MQRSTAQPTRAAALHALRHYSATELLVQLAAEYTVAAGTAHRAMALLQAEGLITVTRGRRATVAAADDTHRAAG